MIGKQNFNKIEKPNHIKSSQYKLTCEYATMLSHNKLTLFKLKCMHMANELIQKIIRNVFYLLHVYLMLFSTHLLLWTFGCFLNALYFIFQRMFRGINRQTPFLIFASGKGVGVVHSKISSHLPSQYSKSFISSKLFPCKIPTNAARFLTMRWSTIKK